MITEDTHKAVLLQAGSGNTSADQARQEGFAAIRAAARRLHTLCWTLLSSPFPALCSLSAGASAVELTPCLSWHCHSAELSSSPRSGSSQAGTVWD